MKTNPITSIVDLDGQPFTEFDRASALRDLLVRETGSAYRVDRDEKDLGFVVRRLENNRTTLDLGGCELDTNLDRNDSPGGTAFTPWVLRPALRTSLPIQLPFMLLGLYLYADSISLLSLGISMLGGSLPWGIDSSWLASGVRLIGILLLVSSLWSVFVPWLASRYLVSAEGIAMEHGIIARDVIQIRYRDIRSVGLKQGLIERLLNVGTVEFAAAGTDEVDISFAGIARPSTVRTAVQKIMDERQ